MIKLRHISGDNLPALEKAIEEISLKKSIMIHSITNRAGQWFIHFVLVEPENGEIGIKLDEAKIPKLKGTASTKKT